MDYRDWLSRNNIPFYPSDSDYTTNSPSYYENLARKTKLIKMLAEKIWGYDEELAKRFLAWDKKIDLLDEEVFDMIERWADDGSMSEIIANTIMYKSNIIVSEFEPMNANEQTYWFEDVGESGLNMNITIQALDGKFGVIMEGV